MLTYKSQVCTVDIICKKRPFDFRHDNVLSDGEFLLNCNSIDLESPPVDMARSIPSFVLFIVRFNCPLASLERLYH